jgi:phage pi2 protein 07
MMQEMYDWYMDNLFPEHRRQAIKHAEKDGRDRKKRLAQGPTQRTSSKGGIRIFERKMLEIQSGSFAYNPDRSVSKWERIGSPMVSSWIDWALIIEPTGWADPYRRRAKLLAVQRQYDRYQEYTN